MSHVCECVANVAGEHVRNGHLPVTLGGDHSLVRESFIDCPFVFLKPLVVGHGYHIRDTEVCIFYEPLTDLDTGNEAPTRMRASYGWTPMLISTPLTRQLVVGILGNHIGRVYDCDVGNIHGMPVSFLLGLGPRIPEFSWVKPLLKPERLVYIGLRDLDAGEKKILKDNNIRAFSMHHVDKYGIGRVVEMALDHVNPNRDLPIHLSFDVDALDPSVAPSTGTPASPLPPRNAALIDLSIK